MNDNYDPMIDYVFPPRRAARTCTVRQLHNALADGFIRPSDVIIRLDGRDVERIEGDFPDGLSAWFFGGGGTVVSPDRVLEWDLA